MKPQLCFFKKPFPVLCKARVNFTNWYNQCVLISQRFTRQWIGLPENSNNISEQISLNENFTS